MRDETELEDRDELERKSKSRIPTLPRWVGRLSPALLGASLVLILRGNQVAALLVAALFFVIHVTAKPPRPRPRSEEGEG